ncbi:MAG: DUF72 domain-containing protein, partial [Deltaproteobacteria bacterium]|nr:DUF72 domain-containing protein [Deltaproteobacteria bacterium]
MAEILVGTSGFYYEDWRGEFYPPDLQKKDFLGFYAQHFKVIELNYSYYKMPDATQSKKMIAKSGSNLDFVIKANREMTHNFSTDSLDKVIAQFARGISPFHESGRLGGILLQFPQQFHYTRGNRIYLKTLIEALSPYPLFVEFRQKTWLKESVYDTLRELGVGFVCVDEPPLPSLIPPINVLTAPSGYIRFHGRNRKNWYGTDSKAR